MKMLKGKKGFTLIELVIVIAILGILAGLAIPRFLNATATARGARIVADMRTIDSAIVIYNAKTGGTVADFTAAAAGPAALTSDNAAASQYQLLAAWPAPPTGTATITANDGTEKSGTIASGTNYGIKSGRATLGEKNVTTILTSGF